MSAYYIAFVTEPEPIRKILELMGETDTPPPIHPSREPLESEEEPPVYLG
jgi:hypothetical protein